MHDWQCGASCLLFSVELSLKLKAVTSVRPHNIPNTARTNIPLLDIIMNEIKCRIPQYTEHGLHKYLVGSSLLDTIMNEGRILLTRAQWKAPHQCVVGCPGAVVSHTGLFEPGNSTSNQQARPCTAQGPGLLTCMGLNNSQKRWKTLQTCPKSAGKAVYSIHGPTALACTAMNKF